MKDLRDPSFRGLHSKKGDHCHGAIVIVEGFAIPNSHVDLWGCWVVQGEDKVLTPKKKNYTIRLTCLYESKFKLYTEFKCMTIQLTGTLRQCFWTGRCRRRTSRWTAGRRPWQRWAGRGCRRWGCWRRSWGRSWRSRRQPWGRAPCWSSWAAATLGEASSISVELLSEFPCK